MNKHPGITPIQTKTGVRYQVRYRNSDGQQRSKNFRTLAEAKAFKNDVDFTRRTGPIGAMRADKVTFASYAASWAAGKAHRPSTVKRRDGIINNHLNPALGRLTLNKIRHGLLQAMVDDWVAQQKLSSYSIRNHIQVLKQILDRAVREEILTKNPAKGLDLPKTRRPEPRALTAEECLALIEAAGPMNGLILETLLATGCRWAELQALNLGDFNPRDRLLHIQHSKTEAGVRIIPLDTTDSNNIIKHLMSTGRSGGSGDGPLFTSQEGHRLNYANFRTRVFIPACERAGLTDVTLHSLRRTHATMLISGGHNAKTVQHRMGHASIQTTLAHYAVATAQDRNAAASAKSDYLAAPQLRGAEGQEAG